MNEIKVNFENLSQVERETLMKLVEKGSKPKSRVPHPTQQNKGYVVNVWSSSVTRGDVYMDEYLQRVDELGLWFPTREEAEEEITRLKMLTKWKHLSIEAGEADNPWDGKRWHWTVAWDSVDRSFYYQRYGCTVYATTFFPTVKSLKAAIAELGEDNVKKYILGVKE